MTRGLAADWKKKHKKDNIPVLEHTEYGWIPSFVEKQNTSSGFSALGVNFKRFDTTKGNYKHGTLAGDSKQGSYARDSKEKVTFSP